MNVRIATRGSDLARWQANAVLRELEGTKQKVVGLGGAESRGAGEAAEAKSALGEGVSGELVIVSTAGDRDLASSLSEIGGKGVFVKEVQTAVLAGEADIAVHSAKDMPAQTPEGLTIGAVLKRGDPRDALVGCRLADLPNGATVATGAPRRRAQLAALRPDLHFADLRGNIATRLAKAGNYDAIVVAVAALERLGFAEVAGEAGDGMVASSIVESDETRDGIRAQMSSNLNLDTEVEGIEVIDVLDPATFIPQVGQGTIAVECRSDDEATKQLLATISHSPTRICLEAERGFLQALGGDCNLPAGAYATLLPRQPEDKTATPETTLKITAFVATANGTLVKDTASVPLDLTAPLEVSTQTASTTGQALTKRIAGGVF